jgi:diphthamide biosynthesis enzyme Dph1/Dph2-like protein
MYSIDLKKASDEISKEKPKLVLLQFPDGLKPKAKEIKEQLKQKHQDTNFIVWAGSCFGSCDIPLQAKSLNVDLILHFGHPEWKF